MSGGEFVAGMALLALTLGSALVFAAVVMRRRLPELDGAPRAVAFGLIAALGLFVIHLVPGALSVLGKPGVALAAVALLLVAALMPSAPASARQPPYPPGPPSGRLSWALAWLALGIFALYVVAFLIDYGGEAIASVDMTTFHLPNIARWIQSGSFWQDDEFVPYRSFGTYPNTSDVFTLAVILPFGNDFLVRFVAIPFLALTGVAIYSLARELTAPAAASGLVATGFVAMPVVSYPAFEGLADTFMLASFSSGLLFLFRHRRTGATSDLVLAGLGLGLSFGTKWYAMAAVCVTLALWLGVAALEHQPARRTLIRLAGLTGIIVAGGGFWLLRNLVEVGNPVFPVKASLGDLTLFDAPHDIRRERLGFSLSDYLDEPRVWREVFWPAFLGFMSWFAVLLWVMLPVSAAVAWARLRSPGGHSERARSALIGIAIAAVIGVLYLFLPFTAQGLEGQPLQAVANARYVVPALVLGAAVAAWAVGGLGRAAVALEVAALFAFFDALSENTNKSGEVSAAALAAAALALAVAAGLGWFAWRRAPFRARRTRALAAGIIVAVLAVAGLYKQEQRFNDHRYKTTEPTNRWVIANAPSGARIGVAGEGFVVYQLFGPRLENEVEYVGPVVDGLLRPLKRPEEFRAALRKGRYDLVMVGHNDLLSGGVSESHVRTLRALGYTLVASERDPNGAVHPKSLYKAPTAKL